MRVWTRLMIALLVAAVGATLAYGAGYALEHERHAVTSSPHPTAPAEPTPPGNDGPATPRATPDRPATPETAAPDAPDVEPSPRPGPRLLGPGDDGAEVRDLQARLKQIAWLSGPVTAGYDATTEAAVRGFQAKREIPVTGEVDRRTLERLHAMTRTPTHEELHNIVTSSGHTDAPLDPRCTTGRAICVDKTSRTVRWVVDGVVKATFDARFGAAATPTREGAFTIRSKSRDHVSSLYGSPMPFAMFFSGGQAVHYSSDFASVGYNGASHGCVNIRDREGVAWLFDQAQVGDKVIVHRS